MYSLLLIYSSIDMLFNREVQVILILVCVCSLLLCFVCFKYDTEGEDCFKFNSWLCIYKGKSQNLQTLGMTISMKTL